MAAIAFAVDAAAGFVDVVDDAVADDDDDAAAAAAAAAAAVADVAEPSYAAVDPA